MKKIVDGMKNEAKFSLVSIIICLTITILSILTNILNNRNPFSAPMVYYTIIFFILFLLAVYTYTYDMTYRLEISDGKIKLKTLFSKINLSISDISSYESKKYGISRFYQYTLIVNDKKFIISTRYKTEFDEILENRFETQ